MHPIDFTENPNKIEDKFPELEHAYKNPVNMDSILNPGVLRKGPTQRQKVWDGI